MNRKLSFSSWRETTIKELVKSYFSPTYVFQLFSNENKNCFEHTKEEKGQMNGKLSFSSWREKQKKIESEKKKEMMQ